MALFRDSVVLQRKSEIKRPSHGFLGHLDGLPRSAPSSRKGAEVIFTSANWRRTQFASVCPTDVRRRFGELASVDFTDARKDRSDSETKSPSSEGKGLFPIASQAIHFPRAFGVLFLEMSSRDSHLSSPRRALLLQVVVARTEPILGPAGRGMTRLWR